MTERGHKADIPKMVATAMTVAPGLTIRLGFSYLRMKRRSRMVSKAFRVKLEQDGVPPDLAKRLEDEYGSEISLRKLLDKGGGGLLGGLTQR